MLAPERLSRDSCRMCYSMTRQTIVQRACVLIFLLSLAAYILLSTNWLCATLCPVGRSLIAGVSYTSHDKKWDLFYHLGGNGPWIPHVVLDEPAYELPPSCSVEQVHMLARHAERYPTRNAGARHLSLLRKLQSSPHSLHGPLSFLRDWSYFTDPTNAEFENLTTRGPFAGTLEAFNTGAKMRERYTHLIPEHSASVIWSCSSPRDIETAKRFTTGFLGQDWESNLLAKIMIIPESQDRGGDTLTPGETCIRYRKDKDEGHDYGYKMLAQWQERFSSAISRRLQDYTNGLAFTPLEVYSMMEMCGFETLARGSSPWCHVFSHNEWTDFEYARDVLHFYRAGPGNKYAGAMGMLWLNATLAQMSQINERNWFLSFVHDSDIVAVIAAMGILNEASNTQALPVDHVKENRRWRMSDVIPMGGHMVFEKIRCHGHLASQVRDRLYLRLLLNDGIFDLGDIVGVSGLKGAVTLEKFSAFVHRQGERFGNFSEICGLPRDAPTRITFFE